MERRDQRCYCGHTRGNHNNEGMCPLSAIAYRYDRFPGDDYCKCQGFIAEQSGVTRFRISTHDNGYYCVSIPNYDGGEVVVASEYDREHAALVEQRDQLVEALEGLIHDLPADERLAVMIFSLDRAERVLEEVKQCQQ